MPSDNPLALSFKGKGIRHEKIFEEEVKKVLQLELGCDVEKLHGSEFQTGLPDLLVLHNARILLIELKWTNSPLNSTGEVFGKLKGRQRGLILLCGKKGAPVWILTGIKEKMEFQAYLTHAGNREWKEKPMGPFPLQQALLQCLDSSLSSVEESLDTSPR